MMGERIDPAVAAAKKCAQHPAHETNEDRAPKGAPEAIDMKAVHQIVPQVKQQSVHDENEKPESKNNQRRREEEQNGAEESVEDTEEQRCAEQGSDAVVTNPANDRGRDHDGHSRDCPSENKMPHPKCDGREKLGFRLPDRALVGKGLADLKQK